MTDKAKREKKLRIPSWSMLQFWDELKIEASKNTLGYINYKKKKKSQSITISLTMLQLVKETVTVVAVEWPQWAEHISPTCAVAPRVMTKICNILCKKKE